MDSSLPAAYRFVLAAELLGLVALHLTHPTTARQPLGHLIGWVGTASMCVMHVYSLRRRVKAFARLGRLRAWLDFHIFLGLQGAMLVTFHSLHLKTLANISGATIACTIVVVTSGFIGRYLYSLLPRSIAGERLSHEQVTAEIAALAQAMEADAPNIAALARQHSESTRAPVRSIGELIRRDLEGRRELQALLREIDASAPTAPPEQRRRLRDEMKRSAELARRRTMLQVAERLFRNWSVLHKPLTLVLAGTVVLHIVAHYVYAAAYTS